MFVDLYINWYGSRDARRNEENSLCLKKNLENPLINKIHLMVQGEFEHKGPDKVVVHSFTTMPKLSDFFSIANSNSSDISIIANTDIFTTIIIKYPRY